MVRAAGLSSLAAACLGLVLLVAPGMAARLDRGSAPSPRDGRHPAYEIKAMYLRNFAMFTSWPREAFDGPRDPLVIAIVGVDPFGALLKERIGSRLIGTRKVELRRYATLKDLGPAHLVFLGELDDEVRKEVIAHYLKHPTLLVGEEPGLARQGCMINFFFDRDRVRFEINPAAAKRVELVISSQLLKLARVIREEADR